MKRIIKPHEVRRNELLDTAQDFFSKKGYETTSVADIIEAAGIAKGTFYHYFKSKEDLLDQLVKRLTKDIDATLDQVINARSLNGLEKLNRYFAQVANLKLENRALIEMLIQTIYKDENILLRQKMFRQGMDIAVPKLEIILNQGSAEGLFNISHPQEAAEHIMMLISSVNERMALLLLEAKSPDTIFQTLNQKYASLEDTIERILEAPEKSVCFVKRDLLSEFLNSQ